MTDPILMISCKLSCLFNKMNEDASLILNILYEGFIKLMAESNCKLPDENAIFAKLAKGSESAFETIYHSYNKRLAPFIEKMVHSPILTEEIVQEIFVHLWINRHLLEDVRHPTAYLFNIATNR
jgi:hypothetical protein